MRTGGKLFLMQRRRDYAGVRGGIDKGVQVAGGYLFKTMVHSKEGPKEREYIINCKENDMSLQCR